MYLQQQYRLGRNRWLVSINTHFTITTCEMRDVLFVPCHPFQPLETSFFSPRDPYLFITYNATFSIFTIKILAAYPLAKKTKPAKFKKYYPFTTEREMGSFVVETHRTLRPTPFTTTPTGSNPPSLANWLHDRMYSCWWQCQKETTLCKTQWQRCQQKNHFLEEAHWLWLFFFSIETTLLKGLKKVTVWSMRSRKTNQWVQQKSIDIGFSEYMWLYHLCCRNQKQSISRHLLCAITLFGKLAFSFHCCLYGDVIQDSLLFCSQATHAEVLRLESVLWHGFSFTNAVIDNTRKPLSEIRTDSYYGAYSPAERREETNS